MAQLLKAMLAFEFAFGFGERSWSRDRRSRCWQRFQAHAADVEIFFETIQLEEVGKFERAHIAASFADFALEIADEPAQVLESEACVQVFIPLPFAVKAQA